MTLPSNPVTLLFPILLTIVLSCAIREERIDCPSTLSLNLSEARGVIKELSADRLDLAIRGENEYADIRKIGAGDIPNCLEIQLPRGYAGVGAFAGGGNMQFLSGTLLLPIGHEADMLWGYCADIDCTSEHTADTVILHKQFCTIDINISGMTPDENCHINVEGNWNGLGAYDLTPVKGDFNTLAVSLPYGGFRVRVPRQGDNSLKMHLMRQTRAGTGELIKTFSIGEIMAGNGYNWDANDLDDIAVTIDYATLSAEISITGWDGGGSKDYIL